MSKIDFSKTQYVEISRKGEQVIEGIKLHVSMQGEDSSYINLIYPPPLGGDVRIPMSPTQARTVGELLINYADQNGRSSKPWLELEYTIPRNTYPIDFQGQRNAVSTSDEIDVSFDAYGVTLVQPIAEGPRPNNEVFLSKVQMESLLRQMVKHTPSFRKQLKTILDETV